MSASGLQHLQALPDGLKPVVVWQPRDIAYVAVCEGLVKALLIWRKDKRPGLPDHTTETITRKRVLDVGLPLSVGVGSSTVLALMIRRPESHGLAGLFNLELQYGIKAGEVQSTERFRVTFPREPDGTLSPAEFEVVLETADFECANPRKVLDLPARGDSDVCVFLLTPRRLGRLLVNVELRHRGKRVTGCLLKSEGVEQSSFAPAVQSSVGVEIRVPSAPGVRASWAKLASLAATLAFVCGVIGIVGLQNKNRPYIELPPPAHSKIEDNKSAPPAQPVPRRQPEPKSVGKPRETPESAGGDKTLSCSGLPGLIQWDTEHSVLILRLGNLTDGGEYKALITGRLENAPFERTVEVPHSSSNVIYPIPLPGTTSVAQVKIYETRSGDSQVAVCSVRPIVRR